MQLKLEHLYELAWILPSIALPFGMLVALTVTAFGAGIHIPSQEQRIDPTAVRETAPFDELGVFETGADRYEVRLVARTWAFEPNEIRIPAGSEVTFVATSQDVMHGLLIHEANVNVMLIPGQVARVTTRFDEPGTYPFICHEFCGAIHHTMWGQVIVEEPPAEAL